MTPREMLNQYHTSEKIRDGIRYIAKPHEPAPTIPKPDPLLIAQQQLAKAYFLWAQALRGII